MKRLTAALATLVLLTAAAPACDRPLFPRLRARLDARREARQVTAQHVPQPTLVTSATPPEAPAAAPASAVRRVLSLPTCTGPNCPLVR